MNGFVLFAKNRSINKKCQKCSENEMKNSFFFVCNGKAADFHKLGDARNQPGTAVATSSSNTR